MDEIELYKQMLTKDPTSQAFVYLSEAFYERKMYGEAIETCTNGLRHTPHSLRARVILGLSCLRSGNLERAETELLKAKEMVEINAVTYQALAELYDRKGAPQRADAYRRLYQCLFAAEVPWPETKEDATGGEPEAEKTPEEDPGVATVTMAEIYAQQGHLDKAAAVYRKILETAPGTVGVEDRLAKLENKMRGIHPKRGLLSILETLCGNLRARATARATSPPSEPVSLDPEKLAAFMQKHAKGLRSS